MRIRVEAVDPKGHGCTDRMRALCGSYVVDESDFGPFVLTLYRAYRQLIVSRDHDSEDLLIQFYNAMVE